MLMSGPAAEPAAEKAVTRRFCVSFLQEQQCTDLLGPRCIAPEAMPGLASLPGFIAPSRAAERAVLVKHLSVQVLEWDAYLQDHLFPRQAPGAASLPACMHAQCCCLCGSVRI